MSTVTIPDKLIARLRAMEGDECSDAGELVARALEKYVNMPAEKREELVRRARARAEALARAGISEEEILEHFEQWRHRQRSGG